MDLFIIFIIVEGIRTFNLFLAMILFDISNSDFYTKEYWIEYTELNVFGVIMAFIFLIIFTSSLELFVLKNICHKLFYRKGV